MFLEYWLNSKQLIHDFLETIEKSLCKIAQDEFSLRFDQWDPIAFAKPRSHRVPIKILQT